MRKEDKERIEELEDRVEELEEHIVSVAGGLAKDMPRVAEMLLSIFTTK